PSTDTHRSPGVGRELIVRQDGQDGAFATLQDAFDSAQPGDHILVHDERITGALRVDKPNIRIDSAIPGRRVIWSASTNPEGSLLSVNRAANFHLKGFMLDGGQHLADLVTISGLCPGLVLDDVQLQGFTRAAIALADARGKPGDDLQLLNLKIVATAGKTAGTGLLISGEDGDHLFVEGSRFDGPMQSALQIAGWIQNSEVRGCQISKMDTALRYGFSVPRHTIGLQWIDNRFTEVKTALWFDAWPIADSGSSLVLRGNMFSRTGALVHMEPNAVKDKPNQKLFAGSSDNKRDAVTKPDTFLPTTLSTQH
ncbi:MAG TPA: hypothetical protein VFA18_12100, partial [Gemmataceae bacterium]|nr:hypothetical protein [Gemmataceae bacterium]